jgi:anti-anti-sigma regulatory factor
LGGVVTAEPADGKSGESHSPPVANAGAPVADQDDSVGPLQIVDCACHEVGLLVAGEIDLNGHDDWEKALRRVISQGTEVHVHLTELRFIDVRGVTLLVNIADGLGDEQRIVAHGAPPGFDRVIRVLWPDCAAGIVIEGDQ